MIDVFTVNGNTKMQWKRSTGKTQKCSMFSLKQLQTYSSLYYLFFINSTPLLWRQEDLYKIEHKTKLIYTVSFNKVILLKNIEILLKGARKNFFWIEIAEYRSTCIRTSCSSSFSIQVWRRDIIPFSFCANTTVF